MARIDECEKMFIKGCHSRICYGGISTEGINTESLHCLYNEDGVAMIYSFEDDCVFVYGLTEEEFQKEF